MPAQQHTPAHHAPSSAPSPAPSAHRHAPAPTDAPEPTLTERQERRLAMALGLFDLTERDRRLIAWLATWDRPTVDAMADLLARAVSPGRRSATPGGQR